MAIVFETKESVIFVGGLGTKIGDANAGGGCTKTFWGDLKNPSKSLSDVMSSEGEPLSESNAWNGSQDACDVVNNGSGKVRITKVGQAYFDNMTSNSLGVLANVNFAAIYTDGRYEVIALDTTNKDWVDIDLTYSADTTCDVKVGGAFDKLQNASDNTDASNWYDVYILTNKAETFAAVGDKIDVDVGGGNNSYNSWKRIIGIDNNGVELSAGSYVKIDNSTYDIDCFGIGDVNNIEFKHIWTATQAGSPTKAGWRDDGTVEKYGFSFVECKSTGHERAIEFFSYKHNPLVLGGDFSATERVLYFNGPSDVTIKRAVLENNSGFGLIQIYNNVRALLVEGCIFKKSGSGAGVNIGGWAGCKITNNVFYNVASGIYIGKKEIKLTEYNNIYVVAAKASGKAIDWGEGSIAYSDYSCLWALDGAPEAANRWGGGGKPEHAIEENPDFVNADSDDCRTRNKNVLRGGMTDIDDHPRQMGAVLQKYQFERRARGANVGRMQIIR